MPDRPTRAWNLGTFFQIDRIEWTTPASPVVRRPAEIPQAAGVEVGVLVWPSRAVASVQRLSALVRLEAPAFEEDDPQAAVDKLPRNRYARRTRADDAYVRVERRAARDATSVDQHKGIPIARDGLGRVIQPQRLGDPAVITPEPVTAQAV